MKFSLVRLRVRLSWSTQILFRHVLGLRTPLPRQGDVTDSFSSVHFCASCERFWTYVFRPITRWDFSVGRHSVPVFVRTRENSLLPSWRSLLYVFAFALFSTCVTGRGLIEFIVQMRTVPEMQAGVINSFFNEIVWKCVLIFNFHIISDSFISENNLWWLKQL